MKITFFARDGDNAADKRLTVARMLSAKVSDTFIRLLTILR